MIQDQFLKDLFRSLLPFKLRINSYMFFVYIIYSCAIDQYYIGQTADLEDRLFRHRNSGSKSTKKANDWQLVYSEEFGTRREALIRENEIKRKRSRVYIERLIKR